LLWISGSTIKPLDETAIVEAVRYKHRLVVVAENHSVIGGLGESVASALLRHRVQPAASASGWAEARAGLFHSTQSTQPSSEIHIFSQTK
jgi:transketolase C-terminal domain/subunit